MICDKNGVELAVGQKVDCNGKRYQVMDLDLRDGKIRVVKERPLAYGRNNWFVEPARLTVVA
jgi:hypothetical protein